MANKRMFSLSVVDTDWFLDLPLSTQALYFHLNMRADDDGFVDAPNSVVRKVGASRNDFDLLIAKRFILQFESGIIVIKHWRMHNTIRNDRYIPTQFQDEFKQLSLKENKAYTENIGIPNGNQTDTECIQTGSTDIDIGLDIDLDLDKSINNNIYNNISCSKNDSKATEKYSIQKAFDYWWSIYPKKIGKAKCSNWFKAHKPDRDLVKKMCKATEKWKQNSQWKEQEGKFIPNPYTWLNRGGWDDEVSNEEKKDIYGGFDVL